MPISRLRATHGVSDTCTWVDQANHVMNKPMGQVYCVPHGGSYRTSPLGPTRYTTNTPYTLPVISIRSNEPCTLLLVFIYCAPFIYMRAKRRAVRKPPVKGDRRSIQAPIKGSVKLLRDGGYHLAASAVVSEIMGHG